MISPNFNNLSTCQELKDTTPTPAFETESQFHDGTYTSTPIVASDRSKTMPYYSLFNNYADDSVSSNLPTTPLSRNNSRFLYTKF